MVTAADPDGGYAGLTVGSFTSVSLDPPLVAFLPDKSSTTWPRLLHGFDRLTAAEFDDCVRQLAATAQRVTELTGGRAPVE